MLHHSLLWHEDPVWAHLIRPVPERHKDSRIVQNTEVSFFLPEPDAVMSRIPHAIEDYWAWQASGSATTPYWGRYHWVLQTYLYLKQAGLPVVLTNSMPPRGVILTHLDCVEYGFRPSREQYLAIMLVDREVPHPRGRMHILHNPVQRLHLGLRHRYMPPWPQVGLVPRNPARADRFDVLGYFGYPNNLHPSISDVDFRGQIARLGLTLYIPPPADWHDFSNVDCVMAIRTFGRAESHLNKPSLKLFNAWLAGVPAVLGYESAHVREGVPGRGYLEATNPEELLEALSRLRMNVELRRELVEHGRKAMVEFSASRTVERWRQLIDTVLLPDFERTQHGSLRAVGSDLLGPVRERILWRKPGWFR